MSDLKYKSADSDTEELLTRIKLLEKRASREKQARLQAEKILEEKSSELHELNENLEKRVIERTNDMEQLNVSLQEANKSLEDYRTHLEELVHDRTKMIEDQAEQLQDALKAEKELNDMQRSFVSMASHEFRTPLAIIDACAQKIVRRANKITSEKLLEFGDKIRRAVKRMTSLMESTLTAARMENGKYKVMVEECNPREIILECCKNQQELAPDHKIDCAVDDVPEKMIADPMALHQVVTNLLSNAVKYSPNAPDIEVSGVVKESNLFVSVRDHGLGIAEEELTQMFGRFFRASTSTGIAGTGIGLNLCKMLVEKHGGDISLESKLGEGSTFTVRIPF